MNPESMIIAERENVTFLRPPSSRPTSSGTVLNDTCTIQQDIQGVWCKRPHDVNLNVSGTNAKAKEVGYDGEIRARDLRGKMGT